MPSWSARTTSARSIPSCPRRTRRSRSSWTLRSCPTAVARAGSRAGSAARFTPPSWGGWRTPRRTTSGSPSNRRRAWRSSAARPRPRASSPGAGRTPRPTRSLRRKKGRWRRPSTLSRCIPGIRCRSCAGIRIPRSSSRATPSRFEPRHSLRSISACRSSATARCSTARSSTWTSAAWSSSGAWRRPGPSPRRKSRRARSRASPDS